MPEKSTYRANVSMKVKRPDGVYVQLQPGDEIPPGVIESWPNPGPWAKRGHFSRIDGKPVDLNMRGAYVPPQPSTDADAVRALEERRGGGSPFPKAGPADMGPGKQPVTVDPSEREMDAVKPGKPIDPKLVEALAAKSRNELNKLAEKAGLKINGSESKPEIAAALLRKDASTTEA